MHELDRCCFPPGIAYSKSTLRYFLALAEAECLVATAGEKIAGFILAGLQAPLAHIITLDVSDRNRGKGVGSLLLRSIENVISARGGRTVLLQTAVDNQAGIGFWKRHGFTIAGTVKNYYLGRIDAYEMRKRLDAGT